MNRLFSLSRFIVVVSTAFYSLQYPVQSKGDDSALHQLIDQHIDARLIKEKVPAAEIADDAEFLRRIYLELTGTIPTATTCREFLKISDFEKRFRLIESLLNRDAFASHMATKFVN